jgi:hypothetical protein
MCQRAGGATVIRTNTFIGGIWNIATEAIAERQGTGFTEVFGFL